MTDRTSMIGYNRRVELSWLEHTAKLAKSGYTRDEIYDSLARLLKDELSVGSDARRGSREKTITILLKTWVTVPKALEPFRQDGLVLLDKIPRNQCVAVHWGMSMAAYPFWGAVAAVIGRLLRLQETFTAEQAKRRVREQYGERETAARSARYVVNAIKNWGLIREGSRKGVYLPAERIIIDDIDFAGWLIEAVLRSSGGGNREIKSLFQAPALFPFQLDTASGKAISGNQRIESVRHGLDEVLVRLRMS